MKTLIKKLTSFFEEKKLQRLAREKEYLYMINHIKNVYYT
jgi:hypothetical protein